MEAYTAALFIKEPAKEILKMENFQTFSKNILADCEIEPGEGMVGWVFREQKPLNVNNFERSTTTLKFYSADEEIKSFLAVPLPENGGVLSVDSKKGYIFTDIKEKILKQMAAILWNIYKREKKGNDQIIYKELLETSGEVDVLLSKNLPKNKVLSEGMKILCNRCNIERCFFVIPSQEINHCKKNPTTGHFEAKQLPNEMYENDGLTGWVINKKKSLVLANIINDTGRSYIFKKKDGFGGFTNFAGVPLYDRHNRVMGAAGFIKQPGCSWDKDEVTALKRISQRLFLAWSYWTAEKGTTQPAK